MSVWVGATAGVTVIGLAVVVALELDSRWRCARMRRRALRRGGYIR